VNVNITCKKNYYYIISYRIQYFMMTINLQINSNEQKHLFNMEIIHIVDIHRKAMRFIFIIHLYIA